jgi:hypothetical protein
MARLLAILLVFTALPTASWAQSAGAESITPPPFTAEEIRQATAIGRTYVFRVEQSAKLPILRTMKFVAVTESGATVETTEHNEKQTKEEKKTKPTPQVSNPTWAELEKHAHFPAKNTQRTEAKVKTPWGEWDGWLFTVTRNEGGKSQTDRFWFAKDLPGAPVRWESIVDGQAMAVGSLVSHSPKPKRKSAK